MTAAEAEAMMQTAAEPWKSADREIHVSRWARKHEREPKRSDTKEQIERCLHCPYYKCVEKSKIDCEYRLNGWKYAKKVVKR